MICSRGLKGSGAGAAGVTNSGVIDNGVVDNGAGRGVAVIFDVSRVSGAGTV